MVCVGVCRLESDPDFGIQWPSSVAISNVTNTCSSGIGYRFATLKNEFLM